MSAIGSRLCATMLVATLFLGSFVPGASLAQEARNVTAAPVPAAAAGPPPAVMTPREPNARGIWLDAQNVTKQEAEGYIRDFRAMGVSRVHIVISHKITDLKLYDTCKNSEPKNFKVCSGRKYIFGFDRWYKAGPKYEDLSNFIDTLHAENIQVVLMIWPVPTKRYMDTLRILTEFVTRHPVYGIELEDEDNWSLAYSGGDFATEASATQALMTSLRTGLPATVRIGVTVAPRDFKVASFANDPLLAQADFISYQTYQNICNRSGTECRWDRLSGGYAAGIMQDRAIGVVKTLKYDGRPIILGVPAYDQAVFGKDAHVNMYTAMKASVCKTDAQAMPGFIGNTYWSYANIVSKKGDGAYARRFLQYCRPAKVICSSSNTYEVNLAEMVTACPGLVPAH